MSMTTDQLRIAFAELNGKRTVHIEFEHAEPCVIKHALLVPAEEDNLVKLTDGAMEYFINAHSIAWVEIG